MDMEIDVKEWLPIRKTLHTLAELSNEEKNTSSMIVELLKEKWYLSKQLQMKQNVHTTHETVNERGQDGVHHLFN
jgi:metal-dependent amidase/aminoacylase/carboxypeptidase family protein